jgi:hypothetical protein
MDWNAALELSQTNYAKRQRAWRTFMRRTHLLAAKAHPETQGNQMLVNNWGNPEAKRIWTDSWKRWHAYSNEADRRYNAIWQAARARLAAERLAAK